MITIVGNWTTSQLRLMFGGFFVIAGLICSVICIMVVIKRNAEKERRRVRKHVIAERKRKARLSEINQRSLQRVQQWRKKNEQLKAEYSAEYEQRKLTIGTIKCSQCQWSGQWGTGMTYEQFFAGNLAEAGIDVARRDVNNDNLSSDNRQYTCPVCNSSGWKKA